MKDYPMFSDKMALLVFLISNAGHRDPNEDNGVGILTRYVKSHWLDLLILGCEGMDLFLYILNIYGSINQSYPYDSCFIRFPSRELPITGNVRWISKLLVEHTWMHANCGRMVWWKGIIVDMVLGKNIFVQVIAAIDLKVLKVKGFLLYILLWVLDF